MLAGLGCTRNQAGSYDRRAHTPRTTLIGSAWGVERPEPRIQSASVRVYVDYGLRKRVRGFLRKIVADAPGDDPVRIFAGKFLAICCRVSRMGSPICVSFKRDRGHGDGRKLGELLFVIVILRFTVCQSDPPTIVMNDDGDVIRIIEGYSGAIKCGLVEVPFGRSDLPNELRKIASLFVVASPATLGGEVVLVPPLELSLWRQRLLVGGGAGDQIAAH